MTAIPQSPPATNASARSTRRAKLLPTATQQAAAPEPAQRKQEQEPVGSIPFHERPVCSIPEGREALGNIGNTKMWELIGAGKIETIRIGRRRLVVVPSLLRLVANLKLVTSSNSAPAA